MAKKQGKSPDNLTYKQRRFVVELPVDWNLTEAAKRAGYSPKVAYNAGYKCMQNPVILEAVNKELQDQQKRTRITADGALQEMAKIAFADIRKAFDENGNLLPVQEMPEEVAKAISNIKVFVNPGKQGDEEDITYTKSVKLWDKPKVLEQIGKCFNMFMESMKVSSPGSDSIEHNHHITYEQKLRDAKQKAQQARDGAGSGSGECDS